MQRRGNTRVAAVAAGLLLATLAACNDTSFKSESPKRANGATVQDPDKQSSDATLKLACDGGSGTQAEAHLVTELEGTEATTVRLEGEFCGIPAGTVAGKLTVLFVVDFSGSMLTNDPMITSGGEPSCGRLAAAKAIVAKLEASTTANVDLKVGMNAFGRLSEPGSGLLDLAAFKAQLTAASICRDDSGDTNYEAAFTGAKDTLQSVDGQKVVYFISDGLPTSMGNSAFGSFFETSAVYKAGQQAADALRALPDLALNAIYLGGLGVGVADVDPQTYLEQITADKSRVRVVTNASDLAAEILKFETPDPLKLEADSVTGAVSAAAFGKNELKVASLTADPSREGVWLFVTEPFTLFGNQGKKVANDVLLTVKAGDKSYKATAKITFAMKQD